MCFFFHTKSMCFKHADDHMHFFPKFDVMLGSWGMIFNSNIRAATDLFEPARWPEASLARAVPKPFPTKSLPLPLGSYSAFTRRARSPNLGVGWSGMGWRGYQNSLSIFFILCGYIDHVHICLSIEILAPKLLICLKI